MSRRLTASRPAAPVTSGGSEASSSGSAAFDSLFAGPSTSNPSSSTSRTLTSSNSAYSLLSRKMAEIESQDDDDRMSIKSGRSAVSRFRGSGGGGSGDGTAKGRSRAGSSASSVRTMRGPRSDRIDEDGDVRMGTEESEDVKGKGKGKETDALDPAASVKRARLRPPTVVSDTASIRSRRSSWMGPSSSSLAPKPRAVSSAQPTISTTTADDLMPSMKSKPHRAASTASIRQSARAASRPSPQTRSSSGTIKPDNSAAPPSPSSLRSPSQQPTPTASSTASNSSISVSPTESLPLAKRGWFGRTSAAFPPAPSDPPTQAVDPELPQPVLSGSPPQLSLSPPPPSNDPPTAHAPPPFEPVEEVPTSTLTPSASRGWLSLLARSKPSNLDLVGEAAGLGKMGVDEPSSTEVRAVVEEGAALAEIADDHTLRGQSMPTMDQEGDTLSLRTETAAPSRFSIFTWGRSSAPELLPDPQVEELPSLPDPSASPEFSSSEVALPTAEEPQPDPESGLASQPAVPSTEARGWLSLRALWGAATEGESLEQIADRRRREAWALKLATQAQRRTIEAVPEESASDPSASELSSSSIEPSAPTPLTVAELRHKGSASWFSRTPLSSSPVTKSAFSSLRAPLASLGVTSSSASTRSRASSHADTTAPSSPQLRPQSDQGPVKPLTGSIRASSSPRQRSTPAFEPPPPIENLVLPSFNDTFLRPPRSFEPPKSTLNRAVSAVSSAMTAYLFHRPPDDESSHPSALQQAQHAAGVKTEGMLKEMQDDPAERLPKLLEAVGEQPRREKLKRVVCLGVHGWFTQNQMIKSVLGEQTGTSVKFATMMHDAVQSYLEAHDVGSFNIQAIALEGQGEVEDRVNKLYNQLVGRDSWIQAIARADAVFVATHSQGSVVSIQLLARLLDQGLIVGSQTHLLAMCGIAEGPFVYLYQSMALAPYFNYLESAPARELFEFQNSESVASIKFRDALRLVLNGGIKITAIGSINDQVVPLYSALFAGVSHPAILRAIFIDGDAFRTSDFLANLVVFSARLRNAGLSDHDLVYHVSEALAGALTGVGHSKVYEEEEVFKLAVRYHFEVTALTEAPTHLDTMSSPPPLPVSFNPRDRRNPYLATWALRGIIEDPQVRELFGNELVALQEAYDTWRPSSKILKDLKLKLEGIRMINRKTGKL